MQNLLNLVENDSEHLTNTTLAKSLLGKKRKKKVERQKENLLLR